MFTGILNGKDFSVDAPVPKSAGNKDTADVTQQFFYIFLCYLFGIDPLDIHLGIVGKSTVFQ